jgi:hypothetical protein
MLEKEFQIFKDNRERFVSEHPNEYVLIVGEKVIGFFPTEADAMKGAEGNSLGSFFIKKCIAEEQDIIEYHSRAVFV